MARLVSDVHVKDPQTRLMVHLRAGEEPSAQYAALVKNPDAWEGGKLPSTDAAESDKPAARKPAAKKPARGRDAADEGDSSGDE